MIISEIEVEKFGDLFPRQACVYDTADFCLLNGSKVETLKAFALFDDAGNAMVGQIFGLRDGVWRAPFSAPFSVVSINDGGEKHVDDFYKEASDILKQPYRLVCAPGVYGTVMPHLNNADAVVDANFHYPMQQFADYEQYLSRSGRYNHHRALKHPFEFFETDDIPRAYAIIAANRQAMGYPLAMSLQQVLETVEIVPAHFFIMTLGSEDVASAMIYDAAPGVAQVIYWGDLPDYRNCRAMNHLAFKTFEWYSIHRPDVHTVDIGPASTDGVRNEGLCQFKLSIGCVETNKNTFMVNKN